MRNIKTKFIIDEEFDIESEAIIISSAEKVKTYYCLDALKKSKHIDLDKIFIELDLLVFHGEDAVTHYEDTIEGIKKK